MLRAWSQCRLARQGGTVTPTTKRFILEQLKTHHNMSLATVRPDGYPQATTVAYANDGLTLYFACRQQ